MAENDEERVERIRNKTIRVPDGKVADDDWTKQSAAWLNTPPRQDLVDAVARSQIGHDVKLRSGERYSLCRTSELLRNRQVVPYHRRGRAIQVSLSRRHLPSKLSLHITDLCNPIVGRFSLDGRTFLTCTGSGFVQQYAIEGRRLVLSCSLDIGKSLNMLEEDGFVTVSSSPDGNLVAFTKRNEQQIYILDFRRADPLSNIIRLDLPQCSSELYGGLSVKGFFNLSCNLRHTDREIWLLGSRLDYLFTHDLASSNRIELKAHDDYIFSTCYENVTDGTLLYSAGGQVLRVWDRRLLSSSSSKPSLEFKGHHTYLCGLSARGDGRHLISMSEYATVKLWDMRRPSSQTSQHDVSIMTYGEKHPDNSRVVCNFCGVSAALTTGLCGFSPLHTTGQRFIYAESGVGSCAIYDILTGKVEREFMCDKATRCYETVRDISWHPYIDNFVAVTGAGDSVYLWE